MSWGGLRLFELVGGINRQFADGDGLLWRAALAQHFRSSAILTRGLRVQLARERLGVVLEDDHAGQRIQRVNADDGAFGQFG